MIDLIEGCNHTSFTVNDLDRSLAFYRDVLEMEVVSYAGRPAEYVREATGVDAAMKVAYLKGYGLTLELIEYVDSPKKGAVSACDNIGACHTCFNVSDMARMVALLKERGVKTRPAPTIIPAGSNKGGLVLYVYDPDGVVVEFIQKAPVA